MAKRGGKGKSMPKPDVQCLPITAIKGADLWPLDEERVRDLTASIKAVGLLNPVLVRQDGDWGGVYLIAGAHRIAAAREVGYRNIAVRYVNCTAEEAAALLHHENLTLELIVRKPKRRKAAPKKVGRKSKTEKKECLLVA